MPLIVLAVLAVAGLVVMALWNALMPDIFRLPQITFWQALGLLLLSRILVGGFNGRPGRRNHDEHRREMIHRLRERWEHMTPEQREKFRRGWRNRWDIDFDEEISGKSAETGSSPVTREIRSADDEK